MQPYSDEHPTGPVIVREQFDHGGLGQPPARHNPLIVPVIAFCLILALGIGGLLWKSESLPWQNQAVQAETVAPIGPEQPEPQAESHDFVGLDIPTSIVIRRGQTVIIDSGIDGAYAPPRAQPVNPPGDNPVWISTSSKVGSDMRTAILAGHSQLGNNQAQFGRLEAVQPGDTIEVTVPTGILTFVVEPGGVTTPDKAPLAFTDRSGMLELVSCDVFENGKNVVVSSRLTSSKAM